MLFYKGKVVLTFKFSNIYNESFSIFNIGAALFGDALIKSCVNILYNILGFLNTAAFAYDISGNRREGFFINAVKIGVKRVISQKGHLALLPYT